MPVRYAVIGLNLGLKKNRPKGLDVWHQTLEAATTEAIRVAAADPNSRWAVAEMVTWFEWPVMANRMETIARENGFTITTSADRADNAPTP